MNAYPTTFAFVQIHHGDAYATAWGSARANFYTDFAGYPTSYFDGTIVRAGAYSYAQYLADYNTRRAVATDVTIQLSAMPAGGTSYTVTANVCVQSPGTAKTMRIYMVQVLDYWPTVVTYSRNGFKQAATTVDITLSPGQCQDIVRTFTFDSGSWANQDDIKIIAWAQEPQSTSPPTNRAEVYQAAIMPWPFPATLIDCNSNGIADDLDISSGDSTDCNSDGVPDECEFVDNPAIVVQEPNTDGVGAQNFDDGYPSYTIKEWDDFTVPYNVSLGTGQAYFQPATWTGFGVIGFLVEIANIPGGAQAGGTVLASTTGTGAAGVVSWNFGGVALAPGTYWISVQANGGFSAHGQVYWRRSNNTAPNGSQHYFHNPGGGWGHGTAVTPGSSWWTTQADLGFNQHIVKLADCNNNDVLDECDIASGASDDDNNNGIPDECEAPPPCRGDCNCDGIVNWRDIDYFVSAMTSESAWEAMFSGTPGCSYDNNDANADDIVNWRDIDPLVALMGATCP